MAGNAGLSARLRCCVLSLDRSSRKLRAAPLATLCWETTTTCQPRIVAYFFENCRSFVRRSHASARTSGIGTASQTRSTPSLWLELCQWLEVKVHKELAMYCLHSWRQELHTITAWSGALPPPDSIALKLTPSQRAR